MTAPTPSLSDLRKKADRLLADYQHAAATVKDEKKALKKASRKVQDTEEAQQAVQAVAQRVQEQAHATIASVVSRCLATVFPDDPYTFKIDFERKRGKTEARLVFLRDGEEYSPLEESGGGVVDVAAFGLRLACLLLTRPAGRKVLCLDEPFKHLDAWRRKALRQLLLSLCSELKLQIVMATHSKQLKIGKVVRIKKGEPPAPVPRAKRSPSP